MPLTLERQPLGQLLVGRGLIAAERLEAALDEQRRSGHQKLLGEILIEMRACTEEQIAEVLALSYGVPFARISPAVADPNVTNVLPVDFLRESRVLPLFLVEDVFTIAVAEPANLFLVEEIQRRTGRQVQVVAAMAADILATIDALESSSRSTTLSPDFVKEAIVLSTGEDDANCGAEKLISQSLHAALRDGAADVHFEPGEDALRVRFRVDGRLVERSRPPRRLQPAVAARLKAMTRLDPVEQRLPQEGVAQVEIDGRTVDLRVHTMPGPMGEKIVVRLLDSRRVTFNVEKLGFSYETLKEWTKLIARPQGLILVTGPVGCGKKSTLYCALQSRAADELNVCTIEDPIAYAIPGVNQFQVNEPAGLTYASGLRALLRQDPDVIFVGELRDAETAQLAAQAALSGQLVFAGINTVDALAAIPRMLHLGVEPYVLASTLSGVLAQRLVRRLCQSCKSPHVPDPTERRQLERSAAGDLVGGNLFLPNGCDRCRNLGYAGRLGVFELLVPDDAFSEAIGRSAPMTELRTLAQQAGLKSLRSDATEKAKAGITSLAEVMRVT